MYLKWYNIDMSIKGVFILEYTQQEEFICAALKKKPIIVKGTAGSGKTTLLQKKYLNMIENCLIPSEKILVLVSNSKQIMDWKKKSTPHKSGSLNIVTYRSFIQSEIESYYPIILKNCAEIEEKHIKPVFIRNEAAAYLVHKVVDSYRKNKGMFFGISASTLKIVDYIMQNYYRAAAAGITYSEIGTRLYNSLEKKDEIKKQAYADMDFILDAYRKKCFKLGAYDDAMTIEIYNRFLLTDAEYRKQLSCRIKVLIVDNLEASSPVEADLIELLIPYVESCILSYNPESSYREVFGADTQYTAKRFSGKYDELELKDSYTCSQDIYRFTKILRSNILSEKKEVLDGPQKHIVRLKPSELRNEMLEQAADRICSLVYKDGYKPSNIAVLSTFADPVTENALSIELQQKGLIINNISRKNSIMDSKFVRALVTFSVICHPLLNIRPSKTDILEWVGLILKLDTVRSSLLAEEIFNNNLLLPQISELKGINRLEKVLDEQRYNLIKNWIYAYIGEEPIPVYSFFQKAFMELMLGLNINANDIRQVQRLVDGARSFSTTLMRFDRNSDKEFIELLKTGIPVRGAETFNEDDSEDSILLATPTAFLANSFNPEVIVFISLASENWSPRSIKELSNFNVLNRSWNPMDIYTEKMEEEKGLKRLTDTICELLQHCRSQVITVESLLSSNGFENQGLLADYFDEAIGGRQWH